MPQDLPAAIERLSGYILSLERTPKALLVDDCEDDLYFLERMIRESEVRISTESTSIPVVAISSLSQVKFDLIFLDLKMEQMSGTELIREIPQLNKETPIVIMSHLSNGPLVNEAIALGAWLHLTKPIKAEQLKLMLSRVKL